MCRWQDCRASISAQGLRTLPDRIGGNSRGSYASIAGDDPTFVFSKPDDIRATPPFPTLGKSSLRGWGVLCEFRGLLVDVIRSPCDATTLNLTSFSPGAGMAGSTLPFLASVVSVERSTAGEKQAAQCLELVALSLGSDRH